MTHRIHTLVASLVVLTAPAFTAEGGAPAPVPVPRSAPEIGQTLEQRLQALDQEVRILKRKQEIAQEEAAAKAKDAVKPTAGDTGFGIANADKSFTLKLGLLVQADGRFWLADEDRQGTDTFTLAKVRPQFSGTLGGWLDYRFLPEFAGTVGVQDAFVDAKLHPTFQVLIGKAKVPFGLERAQSDTATIFPERGITDRLAPNRDVGVQLHGDAGPFGYGIGYYNGAADGSSRDTDINDDKATTGRVWVTPFKESDSDWLNGLVLAGGGSIGYEETAGALPGGAAATGYRTPLAGTTFFSYGAGTVAEGQTYRASPQLYWSLPTFSLLADYVAVSQGIERPGVSSRVETHAWQVGGSWVLTGERPTWSGVKPKNPFAPGNGKWGAWELAARYGQLSVDDAVFDDGFRTRAQTASEAVTWALGVNWYPTRYLKWATAYEETAFAGGEGTAGTPTDREREHFLITRLSLFF
jgi:phosphate-selective porin OprO/OprP